MTEQIVCLRAQAAGPSDLPPALMYLLRVFARYAGFRLLDQGAPSSPNTILFLFGDDKSPSHSVLTIHFPAAAQLNAGPAPAPASNHFLAGMTSAALDFTTFRNLVSFKSASEGIMTMDVWQFSFDLLAGRLESINPLRDAHGRYRWSQSGTPDQMVDRPVVNLLFEHLRRMLLEILGRPWQRSADRQTICLSHDVDLIRKYRGLAGVKRMLGNAIRQSGSAAAELKTGTSTLLGGRRDPYDSFDNLYFIKERINAPSTFFLLTEKNDANADYDLTDKEIRNLILRGKSSGDEFGLHASMHSPDRPEMIGREKSKLESVLSSTVTGSRQHYLRFSMPETWRHLASAGLRYDSTMGFADRAGFRMGWSGPLPVFDIGTQRELPLLEIPLTCMDVTLAVYEKIAPELALERLTNLLDAACEASGGAFVFLWHNTIADQVRYPGYWDTFEYFFSIASGSARFLTLNQLCDEYETQVAALA